MNLQHIDLKLLVFLDALLDEKNVTKAAAKVCVSQPAMSNALNKLRTKLDDPILVRTSQGMIPTQRALDIHGPLKSALTQLGEALAPVGTYSPKSSERTFIIAATDYASTVLLPNLFADIQVEAPDCSFKIIDSSSGIELLEHGNIDLSINSFNHLPDTVHKKNLWEDDYRVIVSQNHPYISESIDLDTYLNSSHIVLIKSGIGNTSLDAILSERKLERHIAVYTKHFHVTPQLVENSNMVATIPTRLACFFQKQYALRVLLPPIELPRFCYSLVWSSVAHHDPANRWLRNRVLIAADQLLHQI